MNRSELSLLVETINDISHWHQTVHAGNGKSFIDTDASIRLYKAVFVRVKCVQCI